MQNLDRDLTWVSHIAQPLATTERLESDNPQPRTNGAQNSTVASIRVFENTTFAAGARIKSAGVILNSPFDTSDTGPTVYRVKAYSSISKANGVCHLVWGAGNATPSATAAGQVIQEPHRIGGRGNFLEIEDGFSVYEFIGLPQRPIVFALEYESPDPGTFMCAGLLSVQRLVKRPPVYVTSVF